MAERDHECEPHEAPTQAESGVRILGVAARADQWDVVHEFFELFKTPWEPVTSGRSYQAVISTSGLPAGVRARVIVDYVSEEPTSLPRDPEGLRAVQSLPLYCAATARQESDRLARDTGRGGGSEVGPDGQRRYRFAYDLFDEVRHLLTHGQPPGQAGIPTLDLHIAQLRGALLGSGVRLIEVPPAPAGHTFICCLTHDIDFFGIRRHAVDSTMAGFVLRGTVGSVVDLMRGRRTLREAWRNCLAVLSLPLVLLRLRPDPWDPIEQYKRADGARPATFFVVPRKNEPGLAPDGRHHHSRAVRYHAGEVGEQLRSAVGSGHEVALHGVDAWRDEDTAAAEAAVVAAASGLPARGVRMHWLYFDQASPRRLDETGFTYDSTCGYNDAVGFRAGTAQAFRWLGCRRLVELPLAIMDTALFFPGRLGLSRREGLRRCVPILDHAERSGGVVVVNWHDRSLVPERLWDGAYAELLAELDRRRPWYATASDAADWFDWRRSIRFSVDGNEVTVRAADRAAHLPDGVVRVHGLHGVTDHPLTSGESRRVCA